MNELTLHYGVFDVETQRSAQQVGGWNRIDLMGVSAAVLYDSKSDSFFEFEQLEMDQLLEHLQRLDLVVGFNIKRFDFKVLSGYFPTFDFDRLPILDLLAKVEENLPHRLTLEQLTTGTLDAKKTAGGLQAIRWWEAGRIREIMDYCKSDVRLTRDLYQFALEHGYLIYLDRSGMRRRVSMPL